MLPDDKALPPPSDEYFEMETAKAFHYRWRDWLEEHPQVKAQMMAHELAKGMRDTYNLEQRQAVLERGGRAGGGAKVPPPWESIRAKFFR